METIRDRLELLPSKNVDKAIKYFEEDNWEELKEIIETSIFDVNSSINIYGKHSKYFNIDIKSLEELLLNVEDKYYDYLNNLEYLNDLEKKEFDENYLEYE